MTHALSGLKVVEFTGLGPAPLAGQLLADQGADVVTIDRKAAAADGYDVNRRGKRSVVLDLKSAQGHAAALRLIAASDVLIEGFRPGVMERLGLGPDDCPDRLIYARMTGWGQTGPLSQTAGHDLTYLALTGALHMIGEADRPPVPPLNLAADFGGGTMFLIFGILSALYERNRSGKGQVVDAAMAEGVPAMMGLLQGWQARGAWSDARGANLLDGGAPFYRCYTCADGKFIAFAALEPQFFAEFLRIAKVDLSHAATQNDQSTWPAKHAAYEALFASHPRDYWAALFEGSDACIAPVLTSQEAAHHPHNQARDTFVDIDGVQQTAPAPRLSRTQARTPQKPTAMGADTNAVLRELGYTDAQIAALT
ncbi:MAG: CaiB/BaiF CoA-transferase family protein [Aliishimia sp.]